MGTIYGQKKNGQTLNLNGLTKQYYVYAGEHVEPGTFVDFIQGLSRRKQYSETYTSIGTEVSTYTASFGAVQLDEERVFIIYYNYTTQLLYGNIITIKNSQIIPGTETALSTYAQLGFQSNIHLLSNNRVFVFCRMTGSGDSSTGKGLVIKYEGTTILPYSITDIAPSAGMGVLTKSIAMDNDTFLCLHGSASSSTVSSTLYGRIIAVGATTCTLGTDVQLNTISYSGSDNYTNAVRIGNSQRVYVGHCGGSSTGVYGQMLTVSSMTVSAGTDTTIRSDRQYACQNLEMLSLDPYRILFLYRGTNTYYTVGTVVNLSSTTPSIGNETTITTAGGISPIISANLIDKDLILCTRMLDTDNYNLYGVIFSTSNTTIYSIGAETIINTTSFNNTGRELGTIMLNNKEILTVMSATSNCLCSVLTYNINKNDRVPTLKLNIFEPQIKNIAESTANAIAKTGGNGTNVSTLSPTNIVSNGEFETDLTGWQNPHTSYGTAAIDNNGYEGKCMKVTVTTPASAGGFGYHLTNLNYVNNHIYYAFCYIKGLSTNAENMYGEISIVNGSLSTAGSRVAGQTTTWTRSSLRWKCPANADTAALETDLYIYTASSAGVTSGMAMYYDCVRVYDLTALYGAGCEPPIEWCDQHFPETLQEAQDIITTVQPELHNIVDDNFSDLSLWTNGGPTYTSSTMENNIYTCTYTTAYSGFSQVGIYKTLPYVKSHIYYMSIECKGQGDMHIIFAGKSYNFPLQSEWKQVSALGTAASTGQLNTWIGPCIGTGYNIGQQSQFKNMRIYDLTEIYGAGNEPDLIWCDANL